MNEESVMTETDKEVPAELAEESVMAETDKGVPAELAEEMCRRIFEEPGFMRLAQVVRYGGAIERISLRPVELKTGLVWQVETGKRGQVKVTNLDETAARAAVAEMLARKSAHQLHLQTASGDLHIRLTRKGRALVSRSKQLARKVVEALPHDREKKQPLSAFASEPLLTALGIADADGRIKASMQGKYDQVNAFLRIMDATLGKDPPTEIDLVDCGCGKAYLTFAAYFYLVQVKKMAVRVRGIDRNAGVIASARRLADDLGVAADVQFLQGDVATTTPDIRPTMTLSLHACDTATDEALARAIEWKSRYILCAPCCQHELNKGLVGGGAMKAVLRHGILRERLADLLTDTFRAQVLRIMGFRVRIVEFVSPEATAKNVMLRAEYGVSPRQSEAVAEYIALRNLWQVTPWLETRLGKTLLGL